MNRLTPYVLLGLKALRSHIASALLVLLVIAATSAYSVVYPSYLGQAERATRSIPWSMYFQLNSDSESSVAKLTSFLESKLNDSGRVVGATDDYGIISQGRLNGGNGFRWVDLHEIRENNSGVLPVDVFTTPEMVVDGDPRGGDGTIIDAQTALDLGVGVGDKVAFGLRYPSGYPGAQDVYVDDMGSTESQTVKDVFFIERTVSAVVLPDSNFSGIGFTAPKEYVENLIDKTEVFARQIYIIGVDDKTAKSCAKAAIKKFGDAADDKVLDDGAVYTTFRSEVVQSAKDWYAQILAEPDFGLVATVICIVCLLATSVIGAAMGVRRRMRELAVMVSCGASRSGVAAAFSAGQLVVYVVAAAIGLAAGSYLAYIGFHDFYVLPSVMATTAAIVAATLVVGFAINTATLWRRLGNRSILEQLQREDGDAR